jgi:hypothetical protein
MRKFMSLVLMGSLLGGSGFVMAQTVPGADQTGENVGAFGSDTSEPTTGPQPTDTAPEPVAAPGGAG